MHGSAHAAAGFAAYDQMRAARAAEQAYRHHSSAAAVAHSSSLHAEAAAAVAASADPLANLHTTAALHAAAVASNSPDSASSLDPHVSYLWNVWSDFITVKDWNHSQYEVLNASLQE